MKPIGVSTYLRLFSLYLPWNSSIACLKCLTKRPKTNLKKNGKRDILWPLATARWEIAQVSMQIRKFLIHIQSRVKLLLSGTWERWELFQGKLSHYGGNVVPRNQMSSTCIKRNLPATEQKFRHNTFPLHTGFTALSYCYYKFLLI